MIYSAEHYVHENDKAALRTLKSIPGFQQFVKAFMKVWSERQFRVANMSSCVRLSERQMPEYYDLLPPICAKLGIPVPELYLQQDVTPRTYSSGETKPFIVVTTGMFDAMPEELFPTLLARECGHIACHHVLYSTMGNILLGEASSAIRSVIPYGGLATLPLEIAFFNWMRCSELSADRAAILCDGGGEKMSEICLRLAGYGRNVGATASREEFLAQAREYRDMVNASKWDKTLEFLTLSHLSHPLMTLRILECEEWSHSEQFARILDGTYVPEEEESLAALTEVEVEPEEREPEPEKKPRLKLELPKLKLKLREDGADKPFSWSEEIRIYKSLLDDGIITEEEFAEKKRQLLGL